MLDLSTGGSSPADWRLYLYNFSQSEIYKILSKVTYQQVLLD